MLILYGIALYFFIRYAFLGWETKFQTIAINCLFTLPLFGLLLFLFRRLCPAILIHSLLLFAINYLDRFVYACRLTHIRYSDFFSVMDAVRVAGRYRLFFTPYDGILLTSILAFNILLFLCSRWLSEKQSKKENAVIGSVILCVSLLVFAGDALFSWIPDTTEYATGVFDVNKTTETDGLFYTLYNQYKNSRIQKPEGYSTETASYTMNLFSDESSGSDEPVRIIVIMNESLTDYSLIGETSFPDPLQEIHDPNNGYFEGKLAVSVYAGYTCNTEFEFLTGCSLQFFPPMYVPFSQLIVSDTLSLARDFRKEGLSAVGIHPYYSQEWNRRRVYQCLGFDQFIAGEDFSTGMADRENQGNITDVHLGSLDFGDDLEYLRGFVSDAECYRKVLEVLDKTRQPSSFIFAVTVQNHGGFEYSGKDFASIEFIPGHDDLNQYLTCTRYSDDAFRSLVDVLSERKERIIVLMFGDHQPSLDFSRFVQGFDDSWDNRYYVPYVFWSNFTTADDLPEVVSVNYLSAVLKQKAGLHLNAWDRLRLKIMHEFPVVTAQAVLNKELKPALPTELQLNSYAIVQYYQLFDAGK